MNSPMMKLQAGAVAGAVGSDVSSGWGRFLNFSRIPSHAGVLYQVVEDRVEILRALTEIGKVEMMVGEFYLWLSEVLEDDPDASGLFYRLSVQERSHANLISYSKKLVHRSPSEFASVDFDPGLVEELRDMLDTFKRMHPRPKLDQALGFAMKIESHHAEEMHRSLVVHSNPRIRELINSLATGDQEHFETLRKFVSRRSEN